MTTTEATPYDRFLGLDAATRSTVVAVLGQDPFLLDGVLSAEEMTRLGAVIDAVVAGRSQARAAIEEAKAEPLAALPPPSVDPLRRRVRALPEAVRNALLASWAAQGLPGLADAEGNSVTLDAETHHKIESLIASAEKPEGLTPTVEEILGRWRGLPAGPRLRVEAQLEAQGILGCFSNPALITVGRVDTLLEILDSVEAEAAEIVADSLGPVVDGRVVTQPVDSAEELDLVPPTGKVADVVAWVGSDPARARAALEAETARAKPRSSLVDKLAPLAGGPGTPAPAPGGANAPASGEDSGEDPPTPAVETPDAGAPLAPVVPIGEAAIDPAQERAVDPQPVAPGSFVEIPTDLDDWPPLKTVAYISRLAAELKVAGELLERWVAEHRAEEVAR